MRLSDSELEALAADIESDRAERKESFKGDAPEKVRQAVCAFANDLPGNNKAGVVFVGLKDDGTSANLNVADEMLRALADIRSDGNIVPIPTMSVEKRFVRGSEIAVLTVLPADAPPVRYKGRTYIRTGPRRDVASAQDERILNERRRSRNLPFDLTPLPFASLDDINRETFDRDYLPGAFSHDVIADNHRTYEERLTACRMIESVERPVPTIVGNLAIGIRPRDFVSCAYIQFLRIEGVELHSPIVDEATVDGRLGDILGRIDDKLKANIATMVGLSADVEERRPNYPLVALQQLVRNAVMHRSYEATNAPIRVTWFSDRIEIINPGGPYGIVTTANFGQPGVTDYRNPHLAEAMKVLGYVQRFGVGIAVARNLLRANGNPPPEFKPSETHVLAIVRTAR